MPDAGRRSVRLRIEGRVQGVAFRAWTVEQAERLRLDGWVRNRRDGSVEALAEGEADAVDRLIQLCHRGPPAARVSRVVVEPTTEGVSGGFVQRETA